jgi:hypothetical protein
MGYVDRHDCPAQGLLITYRYTQLYFEFGSRLVYRTAAVEDANPNHLHVFQHIPYQKAKKSTSCEHRP